MTSDFSTYFMHNVPLRGSEALILSRICLSLLQDVHELLTVTYGLPVWASYTIFGVSTVLLGILLGVVSFYEPSQIWLHLKNLSISNKCHINAHMAVWHRGIWISRTLDFSNLSITCLTKSHFPLINYFTSAFLNQLVFLKEVFVSFGGSKRIGISLYIILLQHVLPATDPWGLCFTLFRE